MTSAGRTPFDYFTRLSASFLAGKIYLTQNPPWLSELIPAGPDKFFVPYPPMPAVLAMPFVFLFKNNFEQQTLAQILGAGIVVLTMLISWSVKKDKKLLIWTGVLTAFGNIMWFLAATGSSWYLGQISSSFFLTFAIYESLNKKRPFFIGTLIGSAYLSRIHVILSLPIFLYFLFEKRIWLKKYFLLGLGILPFVLFDFWYNFARFGTILDKGYYLIPGVLSEPWFSKGLFNLAYIPNNLKVMFLSLPRFSKTLPYISPSWAGLSILVTTPAFIYSLFANIKEGIVKFSWISIILISIVILGHGSSGFAQFGYRFAVDFYPILIFLTIKGIAATGIKWHHWVLLFVSVIVNLWGVLWINKFGWVGF